MRRKVAVKRRNAKRKAKRFARDFGGVARLIREQPCCVCERWQEKQRGRTEAHHEPPRSVGGTSRDLLPLCSSHHRQRHQLGASEFWLRWAIDWRRVIERMRMLSADAEQDDELPVSPLLLWQGVGE